MDADNPAQDGGERPSVVACESSPGRTVFVEDGNSNAWIASDLTVEPAP